ncbi:MAG: GNAT family N-acetyltransferase, partial [Lachnospiraceae bacterium]|nr:GNAT family N-acetyltransferase [Lachnospiraceae bacterium]
DCVYYVPSAEAYAVAGVKEGVLTLYAIFSAEKISLGSVISSFGKDIKKVVMAFTPENNTGFDQKKIDDDDQVMFVRGDIFERSQNEKFMFPEISHA